MAFLYQAARDDGLNQAATDGDTFVVCSSEPANYAGAAAVTLGSAACTCTVGAGTGSGRKLTMGQIAALTASATGSGTHWAITNGTSILVATGAMSSPLAMTNGTDYQINGFDVVEFPTAVAA